MTILFCEIGEHEWEWPFTRGKRPKACPVHWAEWKSRMDREWRNNNKEHVKEFAAQYYQDHQDELREKRREYQNGWRRQDRKLHPEKYKAIDRRRKMQRKNAPILEPELTDQYIGILEGDPCSYCDKSMEQVDHIISVVPNGIHHWENLTAACSFCNNSKNDTPLLEWLIKRR